MSYLALVELPVTLWPCCDLAHCVLVALQAKHDHRRLHPLPSLLLTLLSCAGGSLLTDLLLHSSPLPHLLRPDKLVLASLSWGLVRVVALPSLLLTLARTFKEVYRLRKVVWGVELALALHPSSLLLPLLAGVAKGNGSGLLRCITGKASPRPPSASSCLLSPSSLLCLLLALAWLACELTGLDRNLSYPALLTLTLASRLPHILDRWEKVETEEKAEVEEESEEEERDLLKVEEEVEDGEEKECKNNAQYMSDEVESDLDLNIGSEDSDFENIEPMMKKYET